jgi:N-carbamoyl-L-amino-acid hydrolase
MTTRPAPRANLAIDGTRLWDSLMQMGQIGGTPRGGCNRQALTAEDAAGRALFRRWCEAAGAHVTVDGLGTMVARREGRADLPPVMIGSHLDTQPTGGKFDGVLGVLAGLEVLRRLDEAGIRTLRPIEVVNWTNEEGCRFAPAMLASAAYAGVLPVDTALAARDRDGVSLGDALDSIGARGDRPVNGPAPFAYLELHIEQGPILEAEGIDIGVVTGGQGLRWHDLTLTGFESHAGSTPMRLRRDALRAAAQVIEEIARIAERHAPAGVGTVGQLAVAPNSRNVIPGEVRLSVDLRHPDATSLAAMDAEFRAWLAALATTGVGAALTEVAATEPVHFDTHLADLVRARALGLGLTTRDIISGAGHDAFHMASIAPSVMIFTPCRDGVSHNEAEDILPVWAENGANVLLGVALDLADTPA